MHPCISWSVHLSVSSWVCNTLIENARNLFRLEMAKLLPLTFLCPTERRGREGTSSIKLFSYQRDGGVRKNHFSLLEDASLAPVPCWLICFRRLFMNRWIYVSYLISIGTSLVIILYHFRQCNDKENRTKELLNGQTDGHRRTDRKTNWQTDGPTDRRTNGRPDQRTDGPTYGRTNGRRWRGFVNGFPSSILTVLFGQPIRALRFNNGPITAEIVHRDVVGIENLPLVIKAKIPLVLRYKSQRCFFFYKVIIIMRQYISMKNLAAAENRQVRPKTYLSPL